MAEPYHTGETLCVGRKTRYRPGVYRDLRISNFRRFQHFTMEGLGRVNLLVGPNNCGKTTVLEAIELLQASPNPVMVGLVAMGRGALVHSSDKQSPHNSRILLCHLFHGHTAQLGSEFTISGQSVAGDQTLRVYISDEPKNIRMLFPNAQPIAGLPYLNISRTGAPDAVAASLGWAGELSFVEWRQRAQGSEMIETHVVPTGSLSGSDVTAQLSGVLLNPEEQRVLDILRLIEPSLEGIVAVDSPKIAGTVDRGGIFVKLKGQRERIPIASLGEGMWRLLALALELVNAKGSVLLIDEIDIGLHYTAQADMWRMVKRAAEELDVQVFATTHSRDCIYALAQVARADVTDGSEVTIQRIEGDHAVAYNEQEIVLAAERGIEVR